MTLRLYDADPYLLEFEADVTERRTHEGRPAVVLDRTAFYAESGGQPWDSGTLDGVPVTAVFAEGDDVVHVLERALDASRVRGRVDGARRRDHRQQHHGQHLLSRALVELCGARTVAFHLGSAVTTIDLDRIVGPDDQRRAVRRANEVVWEGRPVRVRAVSRAEAARLEVEVPDEAGDLVRLVEAEGFDLQPCGGTHPRNTAEVGVIVALDSERYKGGTRLHFVCGHRALDALEARLRAVDQLGAVLSAPVDELAAAARRLLDEVAAGRKREQDLLARALDGDARRMLSDAGAAPGPGPPAAPAAPLVIAQVFDAWAAADVRQLALRLTAQAPVVALLGSRAGGAHVVFARSKGIQVDVAALLADALALLGGRGGGRGDVVQGGAPEAGRLEEALERAAAAARLALSRG